MKKNSYKLYFLSVLACLMVVSCNQPSADEHPPEVKHDTIIEIKEVNSQKESEFTELEKEVLGLKETLEKEESDLHSLHKKVKKLQKSNDSLVSELHLKNELLQKNTSSSNQKISPDELKVRALMQNVNSAWNNLPGNASNEEVLENFAADYSVSMQSLGENASGEVVNMGPKEFEQLLTKYRTTAQTHVQLGNVHYLFFDGSNDVFSIAYSALLRVYKNDVATTDRHVMVTATVKKQEADFKVIKYSWVAMGHNLRGY